MTPASDPSSAAGFPPVAELVPHEPPMLLVDALLVWSPERAVVRATIRPGGPFVVDGRMAASFCLELMAQGIAVAQGMGARHSGAPVRLGVLLGSRELSLEVDSLAVGEVVDIEVRREYAEGDLARYACVLRRAQQEDQMDGEDTGEGEALARAVINVMATDAAQLVGGKSETDTDTDTDTDTEETRS